MFGRAAIRLGIGPHSSLVLVLILQITYSTFCFYYIKKGKGFPILDTEHWAWS